MRHAVLDIIKGCYHDGTSITPVADNNSIHHSIHSHLVELLNTRQGSLPHLPDYGLPDFLSAYHNFNYHQHQFAQMIKHTIERYEPRLTNVVITFDENQSSHYLLQLQITANIISATIIKFSTYFHSNGKVDIAPLNLQGDHSYETY